MASAARRHQALTHALSEDQGYTIEGCTIPPKVSGSVRGAVLLSVPHIEAANETVVIPRSSLVRLRWWGEDKPGSSLFRPARVRQGSASPASVQREEEKQAHEEEEDDDEEDDVAGSSLQIKYPVCVSARQLLEYLRDMRELVLDVIDRATRKKYGRATLPFRVGVSSGSEEDALRQLNRSGARCAIHSISKQKEIVGFLVVHMQVQWEQDGVTAMTPLKWIKSEPSVSVKSAGLDLLVGNRPQNGASPWPPAQRDGDAPRTIQQRLSFSSISSSSSSSSSSLLITEESRYNRRDQRGTSATGSVASIQDHDRLDELLRKGRALQRSMSIATTDKTSVLALVPSPTNHAALGDGTDMGAVLAPYQVLTEEVDDGWEKVLAEAQQIQPQTAPPSTARRTDAATVSTSSARAEAVSLGEYNALEMSFDRMELEQTTMDQLRRLREGSVSTRFSPIQIIVSHRHPASLFHAFDEGEPIVNRRKWIAAFAVSSSLRKRTWRANYSHTLPLVAPQSTQKPVQIAHPSLRFRVRCQPQDASPLGRRRREEPRCLDLWAEVPVDDLLEHRDREWVLVLPLRMEEETLEKNKATRKKRQQPVGSITLQLRFRTVDEQPRDQGSWDSRSEEEEEQSVAWSSSDAASTPDRHTTRAVMKQARRELRPTPVKPASSTLRMPVFLALLAEKATTAVRGVASADTRFALRLEYGTPAFFGHGAKLLKLKRSAKAPLRRCEGSSDQYRATFSHMNAFPIDVTDEFMDKLLSGLLILELWLQEKSTTLRSYVAEKLVGVAKIPLDVFYDCVSDPVNANEALGPMTPFIGVDGEFPVIDPLTDVANGSIHVRVAFGSAEQLFNLKSTLAAAVKIQSRLRGYLARKALGFWKQFELVNAASDSESDRTFDHEREQAPAAVEQVSSEWWDQEDVDDTQTQMVPTTRFDHRRSVAQLVIRARIRESFFRQHDAAREKIVGCDVHGQLQLSQSSAVSSPQFLLWWDGHDTRLNSQFLHSLHASLPHVGLETHEMALLFRIEPHVTGGASSIAANVMKGAAVLDLGLLVDEIVTSDGDRSVAEISKDVDLPILWNAATDESLRSHSTLPLQIELTVSTSDHDEGENDEESRVQVHEAVRTVSRTECLLPATIRLCLDFQRVSDVKDLLFEWMRVAGDASIDHTKVADAVKTGTVALTLAASICVGVELHPGMVVDGDSTQDDQGRWHKRFVFSTIPVDIVNGVQALPSTTQAELDLIVHPALVAGLQHESLDLQVLLESDGGATVLGDVAVPLAAVLFRPSGVQGSFPVRVRGDALAGRVGVQIYIDRDAATSAPVSDPPRPKRELKPLCQPVDEQSEHVARSTAQDPTPAGVVVHPAATMNVEDAVASIHSAASSLQERLSRLAMRFDSDSDANTSDGETQKKEGRFERLHEVDDGTAEPSPTLSTNWVDQNAELTSDSTAFAAVDDSVDLDNLSGHEQPGDDTLGDASEVDAEEEYDDEAKDEADDGGMFKPFTLESFGIEEIEFSPIDDSAASPSMVGYTDHDLDSPTQPSEAGEGMGVLSEDMDETCEEVLPIVAAMGVLAEEEVTGDGMVDGEEEEEKEDTLTVSEEGVSATSEPSLDRDVSVEEVGEALPSTEDEMPSLGEAVERVDAETDGGEEAKANEDPVDATAPPCSIDEAEDGGCIEIPPTVEVNAGAQDEEDGTVAANDTRPVPVVDSEDVDLVPASQVHGQDGSVDEETEETRVFPSYSFSNDDAGPSVACEPGPLPVMSKDMATQTDADELVMPHAQPEFEPAQAPVVCNEAMVPVAEEPATSPSFQRAVVDAGTLTESQIEVHPVCEVECQTMDHDGSHQEIASPAVSYPDTASTNALGESPVVASLLTMSESLRKDALPMEKFNIAWELLNEIRALYVHTGEAPSDAAVSSPASSLHVDRAAPTSQMEAAEEVPPQPVVVDQVERVASTPFHAMSIKQDSDAPPSPAVSWTWPKHSTLQAEIDNRLRQSQHEYEETMALSQSMVSMKSWSSTFHKSREKLPPLASLRAPSQSSLLFRADTETERIARIMQGSLNYWLDDEEDEEDDDDIESDE